jgi:hypothetical protein
VGPLGVSRRAPAGEVSSACGWANRMADVTTDVKQFRREGVPEGDRSDVLRAASCHLVGGCEARRHPGVHELLTNAEPGIMQLGDRCDQLGNLGTLAATLPQSRQTSARAAKV